VSTFDECQQMASDCEEREAKLTDWERTFLDSVTRQLAAGRSLTERQDETLERIWSRVT
jgi:hypothetical protein